MVYTISNGILTASFASLGAELMSLKKDNVEYLWQGNPEYWRGRAYNLFPTCGKMWEDKYTFKGKVYPLKNHGLIRYTECSVYEQKRDRITFILESNPDTMKIYPFNFKYFAEFSLNGNTLTSKYTAINTGNEDMYCTFGGHPGFNVPLDNGEFNDYYVEFGKECHPEEVIFEEGRSVPYPIRENKYIDLSHSLFDNDSIFFKNAADSITLKSNKSDRSVTVYYPDMKYIGIWHVPKTDAPFVCLEPWCGSPALNGGYSDLETMADMFKLSPNTQKSVSFDIIIE